MITEKAPPVTQHRDTVPAHIAGAVARALAKLPADRFKSAADFADALGDTRFTYAAAEAGGGETANRAQVSRLWNPLSIGVTAVAAGLVVLTLWLGFRLGTPSPIVRFRVAIDSTQPFYFSGQGNPPRLALAPNGQELVYVGVPAGASAAFQAGNAGSKLPVSLGNSSSLLTSALMHLRFDALDSRPLPGTEGAWAPRFAPDGERVAFTTANGDDLSVKVVSLAGGPPVTVLDSTVGSAVAWGPDDALYYVHRDLPAVYRVRSTGGPPEEVVRLVTTPGTSYAWPTVLPDGNGIIVTAIPENRSQAATGGAFISSGLEVQVFDLGSGQQRLSVAGAFGTYAATGHLVYATQDRTLLAAPFDAASLELRGRPAALVEGLDVRTDGITDLSLSSSGTLAYTTISSNAPEAVAWVGRGGDVTRVDPSWTRDWEFEGLSLSPDGRRAAVVIEDASRGDVWVKQLDRGPLSRLTFSGEYNAAPTWTPDGRSVTFVAVHDGNADVWVKAADGSGSDSLILDLDRNIHYAEWSRDGRWLVASVDGPPGTDDIVAYEVGRDSTARPLIADAFDEFMPALSPDGRWIAYVSDESGRSEVYLRPFPSVNGGRWQLSTDGGIEPIWSRDGRELYFRTIDGTAVMAAGFAGGPNSAATRTLLRLPATDDFERNPRNRLFDVGADGRFIMIQRAGTSDVSGDLVVVLNWFEELKTKVGR